MIPLNYAFPSWAKWVAIAVAMVGAAAYGWVQGADHEGTKHDDYIMRQANQTIAIAARQAKVVTVTETKYVDRFKTIYKQGEAIEKYLPTYVTPADNAACSINAGFVRLHDAAWSSQDPGPTTELDRTAGGVSLAQVAETSTANATICHAWREKAIGLEEFYEKLKTATNGP